MSCSGFSITVNGDPLSVHKLPKTALQPLVEKVVDRHPVWRDNLMNKSGRLVLIKSTLSCFDQVYPFGYPDPHLPHP
jgi:hypothetical protein